MVLTCSVGAACNIPKAGHPQDSDRLVCVSRESWCRQTRDSTSAVYHIRQSPVTCVRGKLVNPQSPASNAAVSLD